MIEDMEQMSQVPSSTRIHRNAEAQLLPPDLAKGKTLFE
jgi:hypothetical protein